MAISCNRRQIKESTIVVESCKNDSCVAAGIKGKFFLVKQDYPNSCWAAVLTMIYSWKAQSFIPEKEVLQPYPKFLNIYNQSDKEGIRLQDELELYPQMGLGVEKQLNPTIKGWAEMIEKYGPLSVTIDAKPPIGTIHAILILGIYGKITGLDTRIIYADPADGIMHNEDFLTFLKMYESKYSVDWLIQIVHLN